MIKAILEFFLILFFLRFIFNFVLPLFSMSKRSNEQTRSNQSHNSNNQTNFSNAAKSDDKQKDSKKKDIGEYIEFEEIKEK